MNEPKKKPGVAFWATVVVVSLPLLYVLGIRPACWLVRMEVLDLSTVAHVYRPIVELSQKAPRTIGRIAVWYAGSDEWGAPWMFLLSARLHYEERVGRGVP